MGVSAEPTLTAMASKMTSLARSFSTFSCKLKVRGTMMNRAMSLVRKVASRAESVTRTRATFRSEMGRDRIF